MPIIIKDCSYPTCCQLDTARIRPFCDENKCYPPVKDFETKEQSKARNSQRRDEEPPAGRRPESRGLEQEGDGGGGRAGVLTKPFRNSKLHIRATMLLKIRGNLLEATMSLKTMRLSCRRLQALAGPNNSHGQPRAGLGSQGVT